MATLEELNQIIATQEQEQPQGFFQRSGLDMFARNFNLGLARLAGLPNVVTELISGTLPVTQTALRDRIVSGITGQPQRRVSNIFPEPGEIQQFASDVGLTFAPGEEPEDLASRIVQNIGTAAPLIPFFGAGALAPELLAAAGGAAAGKALEETEFGQRNPDLARGIGELGGGLGAGFIPGISRFFTRGGTTGVAVREGRKAFEGVIPTTEERAARRLGVVEPSREVALENIAAAQLTPEGQLLTAGQAAGTEGIAGLSAAAQQVDPEFARFMATQRLEARDALKSQFQAKGNVQNARNFLEANLTKRADEANRILEEIGTAKDPAALSTQAQERLNLAFREARTAETQVWNNLPQAEEISGSNLLAVQAEELGNLTAGADPSIVSAFSRSKLGTLKEGKLVGGKLVSEAKPTASAKAIHQFYSATGEKMQRLAIQGGNSNKIRIMQKQREAALADLDEAGLGGEYSDAISLSRDLNEKFTTGAVGRVLGLGRGETPLSRTALSEIVGAGGETARQGIEQALRAAPGVKQSAEDFLKTQFLSAAQNPQNLKIDVNRGNRFMNTFDEVLTDFFPELKNTFQEAITSQRSVDDFFGVGQVSELTPLAKEKSAAALFLGGDPGEEIGRIIRSTGKQRTNSLTDLVSIAKEDKSGAALKGLQSGFTDEILSGVREGQISSGAKILEKISDLESAAIKSGLFNKTEIERLRAIADTLQKIDIEAAAIPISGGVISDIPSKIFNNAARIAAVRISGKLNRFFGGGGFGASLQIANIASKTAGDFMSSLTNDQAATLLVEAVRDPKLMQDLLRNVKNLTPAKRTALFERLLNAARNFIPGIPRIPAAAVVPGVTQAATAEAEKERLVKDLLQLQTQ